MNVKHLEGRVLNYWVAKSAGLRFGLDGDRLNPGDAQDSSYWHPQSYNPANDWAHAGPMVAEHWFAIEDMLVEWFGTQWSHVPGVADNPLLWFMRAFVATQYGQEVEDVTLTLAFDNTRYQSTAPPQTAAARHQKAQPWYKVLCRQ